jgi:hypothetical protein
VLRPLATNDATALPGQAPVATPPARPAPGGGGQPPSGPATWPKPSRFARKHLRLAPVADPVLGVVRAYGGMSLRLYAAIATVLSILLIVSAFALHGAYGVVPMLLIVYFLRRSLATGALVATTRGLIFTPYPVYGTRPRTAESFGALWSDVTVQDGPFGVLMLGGRKVQVGPFRRAFTTAASRRAAEGG